MIKKCTGCGATLTTEQGKLGFTNNLESNLCMRCFNIRNYNKYEKVNYLEDINTIIKEVKNTRISKNKQNTSYNVRDETLPDPVLYCIYTKEYGV